jgi:sedoheptulokinase
VNVQEAILGIDCGTSKIAVALIDPENRLVLDIKSAETLADLPGNPSSRREQDVSAIVAVFRRLLTETLKSHNIRLLSIGLTGQAHGILGLDRRGRALTHYVTWEDGRGEEEIHSGTTLLQEIRERAGATVQLATGYGIVTLCHWLKYGVPTGMSRICGIVDYLGLLLTEDHIPVTDYTMAETTGMFDLMGERWDTDLLGALDIPTSLLPRLSPPTEVAGTLNAPWLLDISNNRDVPVSVTLGDNQAGYLASVREPYQSILVNIGTGSQISLAVRPDGAEALRATFDGSDVTLRPFVDSAFLVAGSALSGGVAYRALKEFFAAVGRDLFGIGDPADLYKKMEHLAERAGSAAGLRIEPLLSGSRSNPDARGIVEGLSFDNLKPGPFIYGIQEGIIRILKDMIDPQLLGARRYLVGSGNGFRRNPLLRRIAAAMFEKELLIPEIGEEAAVGAALNGAVAAGIYKNFEAARELIRYER